MPAIPDEQIRTLVDRARLASQRAYSPYSQFQVGAAVLTDTGEIYSGCNVENASYGLTICAERNAIFQMVSAGSHRIMAVAVFTPTPTPTAPCGACRQVIQEFGADAVVLSTCNGPGILRMTLSQLLPAAFGGSQLTGDPS
jgi:cytidine deaminase